RALNSSPKSSFLATNPVFGHLLNFPRAARRMPVVFAVLSFVGRPHARPAGGWIMSMLEGPAKRSRVLVVDDDRDTADSAALGPRSPMPPSGRWKSSVCGHRKP